MTQRGTRREGSWGGRFPRTPLTGLLDVNRRHHLAESTSRDLTIGEVLDLVADTNEFRDIPLGYGASAGLPELRQIIAKGLGVPDAGGRRWFVGPLSCSISSPSD
jgi:hypothetical protein